MTFYKLTGMQTLVILLPAGNILHSISDQATLASSRIILHLLFTCHPTSLYHTDLPTVSFSHAQINALSNFSGRGLSQNTTLEFASVAEKIPNTWKTIMIIRSEIRTWYVGEVSRVPWSKR